MNGRRVFAETPIYRLLLKPRGCLATLVPSGGRPTLARFVRDAEPGLEVVAPLDFPAEGVVLLTTDGELRQAMAKGGKRSGGVPMTYHIKLQGRWVKDAIERLVAAGVGRGGRSSRSLSSDRGHGQEYVGQMSFAEADRARFKAAGDAHSPHGPKDLAHPNGRAFVRGPQMGAWRDRRRQDRRLRRRVSSNVINPPVPANSLAR